MKQGGFYGLFGDWNFGALGSGISTAGEMIYRVLCFCFCFGLEYMNNILCVCVCVATGSDLTCERMQTPAALETRTSRSISRQDGCWSRR